MKETMISPNGKTKFVEKITAWDELPPLPFEFNYTSSSVSWTQWLISQGYDVPIGFV
jgi:hypothetical protein